MGRFELGGEDESSEPLRLGGWDEEIIGEKADVECDGDDFECCCCCDVGVVGIDLAFAGVVCPVATCRGI